MRAWILERSGRTPDAAALVASGHELSYAQLSARARDRAAWLHAAGVAPGDRIAALLGNTPAAVELFHATAIIGAILVPLNTRLAPAELARQLDDAAPCLLLHDSGPSAAQALAANELATQTGWKLATWEAGDAATGSATRGEVPLDLSAPAAIVYTSGTSSEPKGVVLSYRNLLASAVGAAFHMGTLPSDRWLACLPLFHVGGLAILARSVLAGSAVVLHTRFDPVAVSRALDQEAITIASLVPTMLAKVLDAHGAPPPGRHLRALLLGGAPAPAPLLERAAKAGWPLLPTYGLTEACSQVATLPLSVPLRADGGGLCPLPGVELRIVDDEDCPRPPGTAGAIQVRGAPVTSAYWRRPERSQSAFVDGWFRTGDLGVLDERGTLRVLGRGDDMLVCGGENVHPAEVEAALLAHPGVADAGVAGLPDPVFGQRIAAWIVLHPAAAARIDAASLEGFLRERLAGYKIPRVWHFVAALPRNAGGKLLRRSLAAATSRSADAATTAGAH